MDDQVEKQMRTRFPQKSQKFNNKSNKKETRGLRRRLTELEDDEHEEELDSVLNYYEHEDDENEEEDIFYENDADIFHDDMDSSVPDEEVIIDDIN